MTRAYTKHKDCTPEDTIGRIQGILESAGLETDLEWNPDEYEGACSNRVSIVGTVMGTNGKGTTRPFAAASGYAELMERLQNNILSVMGRIAYSNYDACGFYEQPDERLASVEDVFARHDEVLNEIFSKLGFPDEESRRDALEKLASVRYKRADGMFSEVPYVDLSSGGIVWVPWALGRVVYGSNGMASGNTLEECLVQGLSEIFERYVNRLVIRGEITPPPIPREHLEQWSVADTIAQLEKSGRYRVHVYDGSLGKSFPVVITLIADRVNGTFGIKCGAHPSLAVAVERTLTEAFQGRSIERLTGINTFADSADDLTPENFRSVMRDGSGSYAPESFCGTPDWEFVSWSAAESASNGEMLKDMFALLRREGRRVLIRDVSHLGFPSYHIIVPGMSELKEDVPGFINQEFRWKAAVDAIGYFPDLTPDEQRALLSIEQPITAHRAQVADLFDRPFVGGKMNCWRVYGFLHLSRGEFDEARMCFERFALSIQTIGSMYWHILAAYADWRLKGGGHEDALQLLELVYSPIYVRRVRRDTSDFEGMMHAQFPQMNCDDCANCEMGKTEHCLGLAHKEAQAKIMRALANSTVQQEPLMDRLAPYVQ